MRPAKKTKSVAANPALNKTMEKMRRSQEQAEGFDDEHDVLSRTDSKSGRSANVSTASKRFDSAAKKSRSKKYNGLYQKYHPEFVKLDPPKEQKFKDHLTEENMTELREFVEKKKRLKAIE